MQPNNFLSLDRVIDRHPLTVASTTPLTEVTMLMQEWANSCYLALHDGSSDADSIAPINNSCALIIEDSQLQGIFTERDLVRLIATGRDLTGISIGEVMSREVITLTPSGSQDVFTALNLMRQHRIRHLPVLDDRDGEASPRHRLVGLITAKSIRQNLQPINLMRWCKVEEVMYPHVIHALPNVSLRYAAQLMSKHQVSYVAIVEENRDRDGLLIPLGIITERDIVQFQTLNLDLAQPVERLMSTPLFLVNPDDSLWTVHQLMQQHRVRRLLVAGSQGELEGIITQTSLLEVFDPTEMYGVIEVLQHQVCQLEIERAELWQNRTTDLEDQVRERISEVIKANQQLEQEIEKRQATLRNHQLAESKLRIQARQQAAIAELVQYALAQKNLVALMERAVNLIADLLEVEYCQVLELLPDRKNLLLKAGVGWRDGLVGEATVRADTNSQVGYTLLASEPIVVTDLLAETRFRGSNLLLEHQVVSGMSVIITGRDRPFGVLGIHATKQRIFSQDDLNFVQAIANILAQANERQLAEAELQQQLKFEQLLANISTRFLNLTAAELSEGIALALQAISELTKVDTSYIFHLSEDQTSFSMTHEWVVQETKPQIQNAQNIPVAMFPWSIAQIQQGEIVYVPNINNLPSEAAVDRENWQSFHLRSLICIPLKFHNQVSGWIGFASFCPQETWSKSKLNLLKVVGEIFASTLQRQQIESALRNSEQRFDSILSSLEDVVWSVDPNTFDRFYINSAVEKIYGRQVAEFYDNPHLWLDMVHPEDRERVNNFVQNIIETEGGEIEYRIVRTDGEIRWLCDRARLIRDAEGTPIRLDGILTDISDRKHQETILKDIASGISVEIGENFLPSLVEYLCKAVGVKYAFVGELIEPEENSIKTLAVYGKNQIIDNFEYHLAGTPCKNVIGQQLCVYPEALQQLFPSDRLLQEMAAESYAGMPIFDAAGRALGLISILDTKPLENISLIEEVLKIFATRATAELERQKAEDKIRQQAALLDVTKDAIIVRGLDNQILFWNRGAEQLYGSTKAEVLGQDANELLYQEPLTELDTIQQVVIKTGEWQGELNQVTKAGNNIVVESRWSLVRDDLGNPQSFLVVNTDITAKKQLEAQFLRAQRLESLGTLAGGIAHDLNNILTPILGFAQLLPRKLTNLDRPTLERFKIIETNAQRGRALVKQILTFSRGLEGDRGTVQIRHVIREIEQIIQETFPKAIELEINVPKNLWTINGDVNQLHQVLMNLAVNARDAMPDGGKLTIKAENCNIDAGYARLHLDAQEGTYVLITVADTGVGIPPEIIDRIFEPFFTTKEVGRGTGLGLSTAIGIVKSHGGFVDVVSDMRRETRGTQVKVFFPASETTATATEKTEETPQGHGELILIVDDETSILEVTKTTLETYNYRVLTANNGIDAIAVYAQHLNEIDLVLMDIMMPSMDGKTAIRTLKQINPDVKIIALSGIISSQEIIDEIDDNITAFMPKPYTNDDLLRTIERVVN